MDAMRTENSVYSYKFDFYNMVDNRSSLKREELDGMVYSRVNVNVYAGGLSHSFNFKIKHYHETVRYKMIIEKEKEKLIIKVLDADYKMKK